MLSLMAPFVLAAAASGKPHAFPEPFWGVWDASAEACARDHSDVRIRIDESSIEYWESGGTPVELFHAGERDILVTLAMSGEGETWLSRKRFVLDDRGPRMFAEALPQVGEDYYKTVWFYHRCPQDTPMGWGGP
jgi:hypothetical protein